MWNASDVQKHQQLKDRITPHVNFFQQAAKRKVKMALGKQEIEKRW